jgi:hypothetical protein
MLLEEPAPDQVQQGQGPRALEQPVGSTVIGGLAGAAGLAGGGVERELAHLAAALEPVVSILFIGQEVIEGAEETGAKAAPLAMEPGQIVAGQETGKKLLGEVLGILRAVTALAHVSVKGITSKRGRVVPGRRRIAACPVPRPPAPRSNGWRQKRSRAPGVRNLTLPGGCLELSGHEHKFDDVFGGAFPRGRRWSHVTYSWG